MVLRELPQFAGLEEMWAAWAMREEEVERERLARDKKVARAPNTYVCAAEGCGIRGLQRSALLSCGGKCEGVHKAHYCSKECQKKVRTCSSGVVPLASDVCFCRTGNVTNRSASLGVRMRMRCSSLEVMWMTSVPP